MFILCRFIGTNMNNINGCSQLLHGCIFWLGWTAKSIRRKFLRTRCSFPCAFCLVPVLNPLFDLFLGHVLLGVEVAGSDLDG